jgi:hypothetical protein
MANNRRGYGLAKEYGINTTGMTSKEVWDALAEKGIKQGNDTAKPPESPPKLEKTQEQTEIMGGKGLTVGKTGSTIKLTKREYAILRAKVFAKNTHEKSGKYPIDATFAGNSFYVYKNGGYDSFEVKGKITIVGNEDLIKAMEDNINGNKIK